MAIRPKSRRPEPQALARRAEVDKELADLDKENARRGKKGLPPLSYGKYVQLFGR